MSAHTPGPWTAHWWKRNQKTGCGEWSFTGGPQDSTILRPCKQSSAEVAANARLIAAAPRMLAALKRAAYAHSLVGAARASASDALYGPEGEITAILREEGSNG